MAVNPNCFIITCVGARDGVGKSVFATNLSISFQKETRRRVCLIDLDPVYCGDLVGMLGGIPSAKAISEVAPIVDRAQASLLKGYVTQHSSGVHVFPLYKEARELEKIQPAQIGRTLDLLTELYDFLIIDVGTIISELTLKALERSTAIFIVTTPDLMVVQQSRKLVEQLQNMHFPKEMLKVILNRYEPKGAISLDTIMEKLQRKILTAIVRDDQTVTQAVNMSQPFVLTAPRAIITKNFDDLARNLLEKGILNALRVVEKPSGAQLADSGALVPQIAGKAAPVFKATAAAAGKFGRSRKVVEIDARTLLKPSSASSRRSAGASTRSRPWSTRACGTARASTPSSRRWP
jgi:pilus assembly protein CpaF